MDFLANTYSCIWARYACLACLTLKTLHVDEERQDRILQNVTAYQEIFLSNDLLNLITQNFNAVGIRPGRLLKAKHQNVEIVSGVLFSEHILQAGRRSIAHIPRHNKHLKLISRIAVDDVVDGGSSRLLGGHDCRLK